MASTREIVARAMKDAAFRKSLLTDAKSTLKKEFGLDLPDGVKVVVHENTPGVLNLVLPAPVEQSSDRQLSHEELESVAGGMVARAPIKGGATFGSISQCCNTSSFCRS